MTKENFQDYEVKMTLKCAALAPLYRNSQNLKELHEGVSVRRLVGLSVRTSGRQPFIIPPIMTDLFHKVVI